MSMLTDAARASPPSPRREGFYGRITESLRSAFKRQHRASSSLASIAVQKPKLIHRRTGSGISKSSHHLRSSSSHTHASSVLSSATPPLAPARLPSLRRHASLGGFKMFESEEPVECPSSSEDDPQQVTPPASASIVDSPRVFFGRKQETAAPGLLPRSETSAHAAPSAAAPATASIALRLRRRVSLTLTRATSTFLPGSTAATSSTATFYIPTDAIHYTTPIIPDSFPNSTTLTSLVTHFLAHPDAWDSSTDPIRVFKDRAAAAPGASPHVWCTIDNRWLWVARAVGREVVRVKRVKRPKTAKGTRKSRQGEGACWWRNAHVIHHAGHEATQSSSLAASSIVWNDGSDAASMVDPATPGHVIGGPSLHCRGSVEEAARGSAARRVVYVTLRDAEQEAKERVEFIRECRRLSVKHAFSRDSMESLDGSDRESVRAGVATPPGRAPPGKAMDAKKVYTEIESDIMERQW